MFEQLEDQTKKFDFGNKTLVNVSDNVFLSDENFKQKMDNIDSCSDEELYTFIKTAYKLILYKIANKIDTSYLKGFTTVRFLNILHRVLKEDLYTLTSDYHIYCNAIAYDYLSFDKDNKDDNIANLLFAISKLLNQNIINVLMAAGLSDSLATYVALSYRSSADEAITIPRVNFVLLHESPNFMNTQRIVYIYERLYNSITNLFIHTMCDVVEIDEDVPGYQDKQQIYEYEADAVVTILNNMPNQMIHAVLIAFADYCTYHNYLIANIRYSLRAMPVDENNNSRVLDMIDHIYSQEGKFIM